MDSLDPIQEISRNAECADKLYRSLYPDDLPFDTNSLDKWYVNLQGIIEQYNVTILLPILKSSHGDLKLSINDAVNQKTIIDNLHEKMSSVIDRRKLDIVAVQLDAEDVVIPPFRIKRGDTGEDIYIDDYLIMYDEERNGNKRNNQWKPLLSAFIRANSHTLLETTMEDVAHTSRGSSLDKCVCKLNNILKQNYNEYGKKGKKMSRVSIRKHRGEPTRHLCIE